MNDKHDSKTDRSGRRDSLKDFNDMMPPRKNPNPPPPMARRQSQGGKGKGK